MKIHCYLLSVFLITAALRCQQLPNLYTPFERDVIVVLDWDSPDESLASFFQNLNSQSLPPASAAFAAALYNPTVPIILSSSLWHSFIERAEVFKDALSRSQQDFITTYLDKYQTDRDFLADVYGMCRKSYQLYQEINAIIAQEMGNDKDVTSIAAQINQRYRNSALQEFLTSSEHEHLWSSVHTTLLISYLIAQKFQRDEYLWITRNINDCMYLMIPKAYLEGVKKQVAQFNTSVNAQPVEKVLAHSFKDAQTDRFLTVDELVLGIKFENFSSVTTSVRPMMCGNQLQQSENVIKKLVHSFDGMLPRIFIHEQDLATFSEQAFLKRSSSPWIPNYCLWNVVAVGHGSNDGNYICGLTRTAFNAFLDFFNTLATRFLYCTTCYSAESSVRTLYIDRQTKELKAYNYTIAVGALQAAPIDDGLLALPLPPAFITDHDIDEDARSLKMVNKIRFDQFFNGLHTFTKVDPKTDQKQPITYKELLANIYDFTDPEGFANVPRIRFVGSPWFDVVDLDGSMIRLDRVFVKAKEAEIQAAKRLADKQLGIHDTKLLLVDAQTPWGAYAGPAYSEIPLPITVEDAMPTVASMVVGTGIHNFQSLAAPRLSLTDVVQKFWGISGITVARTYFIKQLIVKNNLSYTQSNVLGALHGATITLENVCIVVNAPDPRPGLSAGNMQGIIFQYAHTWYAAVYSLKDPKQVTKATYLLKQQELPYLHVIPDPQLVEYQTTLKKIFEVKDRLPSLEDVAQFIADRSYQADLVNQYEDKKADPQALEAWKNTLSQEDLTLIKNYEAIEKAYYEDFQL